MSQKFSQTTNRNITLKEEYKRKTILSITTLKKIILMTVECVFVPTTFTHRLKQATFIHSFTIVLHNNITVSQVTTKWLEEGESVNYNNLSNSLGICLLESYIEA